MASILKSIICFSLYINTIHCETFSSTAAIIQLAQTEMYYIDVIELYLGINNTKPEVDTIKHISSTDNAGISADNVKTIVSSMKELKDDLDSDLKQSVLNSSSGSSAILESYAGHPINAYCLLRRWLKIQEIVPDLESIFASQYNLSFVSGLPKISDLDGAAEAILRLQTVYELTTEDMSRGNVLGHIGVHSLTQQDCVHISHMARQVDRGSTVFPELGIIVKPRKNAALLWYNLKHTGEPDERTLHASCPVVLGQKWVANKWIRERGQIWKRPCGLNL